MINFNKGFPGRIMLAFWCVQSNILIYKLNLNTHLIHFLCNFIWSVIFWKKKKKLYNCRLVAFFNIAFLHQFSIKELKISGSFIDLTQMKYYDKATVLHVMQFLVLVFRSSMNVFVLQIYIYICRNMKLHSRPPLPNRDKTLQKFQKDNDD